jgi:hypothetical protein
MLTATLYIVCILVADVLAARWIIALPFGLTVPAGIFAIASDEGIEETRSGRWLRKWRLQL